MLSDQDHELLSLSSKGEAVLFIAPIGKEFEDGFYRIIVDNSGIVLSTEKGEMVKSAVSMTDIAEYLKEGLWEIRGAY